MAKRKRDIMDSPDIPLDFDFNQKQWEALTTNANEILYGGAKGGGKSWLLRASSIVYSVAIPGLQTYLFRRTYKSLRNNHLYGTQGYVSMLKKFVDNGWCSINMSDNRIDFWNGSQIYLRHCQHPQDVENYRGLEIECLLIDELTLFTKDIYDTLKTCNRIGHYIDYEKLDKEFPHLGFREGAFPRILSGSNPTGVGHTWVKQSFVEMINPMEVTQMAPEFGKRRRLFIPATVDDNYHLMKANPEYRDTLKGGSEAQVRAFLYGDWDVVDGAFFGDIFDRKYNIVEPFHVPRSWKVDRAFDFGSAKPYSVGYYAESNGEIVTSISGKEMWFPPNSVIQIGEIYGWNGEADTGCKHTPRQIGERMKQYEISQPWGEQVEAGPADSSIFANITGDIQTVYDNILLGYNSVADEESPNSYLSSPTDTLFIEADKSKGSRKKGWELMRAYIKDAHPTVLEDEDGNDVYIPPQESGLYFTTTCKHSIRTIPVLPRDSNDPEELDTHSEDHCADQIRYRLLNKSAVFQKLNVKGL